MSADSANKPGGEAGPGALKTVVAQAPPKSARSRGLLTVTSGGEVGRVLSITPGQVISLGRSEECTVRFDDASLSRVHARVMRIANEYVLTDNGSTNGTYVNDAKVETQPLRDGDRILLGTSTTLRFSLVDEQEEAALKKIYEAAMRDGLTGIANRKHLEERLDAEIAFAVRHNSQLSLAILDVDFFKRINDGHGHLAGDAVLRAMGALLARTVRTEDLVARYGGEEFVIVARGIDAYNCCLLADRIRQTIATSPVVFEGKQIAFTASAGVSSLVDCGDRRDKATLLSIADGRLYQAKQWGRNRVVGPH